MVNEKKEDVKKIILNKEEIIWLNTSNLFSKIETFDQTVEI